MNSFILSPSFSLDILADPAIFSTSRLRNRPTLKYTEIPTLLIAKKEVCLFADYIRSKRYFNNYEITEESIILCWHI